MKHLIGRLGLAAVLLAAIAAGNAGARERTSNGTVSGSNGRSAIALRQVSAGGGIRTTNGTVQGSSGHGLTHQSQRVYNPATGTVNRSGSTTTNSGGSVSHSGETTHSGPNG
jgi:hypothetical protein